MIQNLDLKLEGKKPVSREELFELVSSWGRNRFFTTDDNIYVDECAPKECYDLSNLDVSKITNLSYIFRYSMYNGDLSKWDVSSCTDMYLMFSKSEFNNDSNSLNSWNTSNIENMDFIFFSSKFNCDISKWDVSNVKHMTSAFDNCPFNGDISKWEFNENVSCYEIFCDNKNFQNKYNYGKVISYHTDEFLAWFEDNRLNISNLNVTKEEINDIDDYLISFNKDINEIK